MAVPVRHLVAVTACVSGVAHTYMAAERLEKLCQQEKWSIKIETQGGTRYREPLNGRGYPPCRCRVAHYRYRAGGRGAIYPESLCPVGDQRFFCGSHSG